MKDNTKKKIVLPDLWQDTARLLFDEGASINEVISALGISKRQHADLKIENEEYRDVIDKGEAASRAWFDHMGRKNVGNNRFNATLYSFIYRMRYGVGKLDNEELDSISSDKAKAAEILRKYGLKKVV